MDSPVLPAYLARIQRISRPQMKESTALNVALDDPVPEVVRPPRQGPVQAEDQLVEVHVAGLTCTSWPSPCP